MERIERAAMKNAEKAAKVANKTKESSKISKNNDEMKGKKAEKLIAGKITAVNQKPILPYAFLNEKGMLVVKSRKGEILFSISETEKVNTIKTELEKTFSQKPTDIQEEILIQLVDLLPEPTPEALKIKKDTTGALIIPEGVSGKSLKKLTKKEISEKNTAKAFVKSPIKKVNKTKTNSTILIEFLTPLIAKGKFTQKELIEKVSEKIGMKETSTQTLLTDARNPKYNKFEKLVVKNDSGILSFK